MARTANKLKSLDHFNLMKLVQAEFAQHNVTDQEFAEYAAAELKCKVTAGNIQGAREALNIPSTRFASAAAKAVETSEMLARIQKLEEQVSVLIDEVHAISKRGFGPQFLRAPGIEGLQMNLKNGEAKR